MSSGDEWSPDEALGSEANEPWDEALDADDELTPGALGGAEGERSLDRQLVTDEAELAEVGAALDDPEAMAVLDGGIDDPDGIVPVDGNAGRAEDAGWDLDADERLTDARLDTDDED